MEDVERLLPVEDAQWGPLRGSYQFLVSVVPPMTQTKIQRIKLALEQNDGILVAYLPDHVYLAVGPVSAVEAASEIEGIDWVVSSKQKHEGRYWSNCSSLTGASMLLHPFVVMWHASASIQYIQRLLPVNPMNSCSERVSWVCGVQDCQTRIGVETP